jgi:hypothetical protein
LSKGQERKHMPLFTYAFHSQKTLTSTDENKQKQKQLLHIIAQDYIKDPEKPGRPAQHQLQQEDPAWIDYGTLVESECGLEGILIKTDFEAIIAKDFEGMGLEYFHKKYGGNDIVHFFMPPLLRDSMSISIATRQIPEEIICNKCNENFDASVRKAQVLMEKK